MGHTHIYYIGEGIDGARMHADAEKRREQGESGLVHNHKVGAECNDGCKLYLATSNADV